MLFWESLLEAHSRSCFFSCPKDFKIHLCARQCTGPQLQEICASVAEVDYVLCNHTLENHLPILIQTLDSIIHIHIIANLGVLGK